MVTTYHAPSYYKSNASMEVILDILKAHKMDDVGKEGLFKYIQPNSAAFRFLSKPLKYKPDFEFKLTKEDLEDKIPAFFGNP